MKALKQVSVDEFSKSEWRMRHRVSMPLEASGSKLRKAVGGQAPVKRPTAIPVTPAAVRPNLRRP
ncbi:MAG: hypothetical protein RQ750_04365 [Roseovarius sp.]|nr:hypothetical protein [Roseovarius sp.]